MEKLPDFFNYKEEGKTDYGYEAIQDFFLSWTLRCASEKYKKTNPLLNDYSKKVLFCILFGGNENNNYLVDYSLLPKFKVLEVKTKRQYGNIDVLAEIVVELEDSKIEYVSIIENKWYTHIGSNQLSQYNDFIQNDKHFSKMRLIKIVIFCDETYFSDSSRDIELCRQNDFKFTSIGALAKLSNIYDGDKTGNYLFDEYWLNL